ncbi:MAG TPA: HDOD domain-containing protein [bacterium]|nr:HDOD domain-containing protein [bacterium]
MSRTMETGTSELSRVFARQLQSGAVELPQMPGTAAQILDLSQQEDTDAAKLSSVIHNDQTIASNVLRVANSAAYAGQVPCASLQQAVSRLGMQLVTEIAMAVAVRGRLFTNATCAELLKALWQHSVLAAFYTKEIARMRRRNVEIAFMCGLLHDIGKAMLLNNVDRVLAGQDMSIPVDELYAAVHDQHIPAGILLAEAWKLPEQVTEAIVCHHDTEQAKSFADMAMMVALADHLAKWVAPDPHATSVGEDDLRGLDLLVGLNIYPDQLDELMSMCDRVLEKTEGLQ